MVERPSDDKRLIMPERHRIGQVLSLGNDGVVTHHHALGLARGARRKEHVGNLGRRDKAIIAVTDLVEPLLRDVMLQGHRHRTHQVQGKVLDQEIDIL